MESWDSLPPPAICPFRTSTASGSLLAVAHDVHLVLSCARPRCIYHSTSLSHADPGFRAPPPSSSSDARALHAPSRLGSSKSLISQHPPHPPPHPAERAGSAVEMATLWSAIALAWAVHLHPAFTPSSQELPGCALLRRCPVFLPSLVHPRARKLRLRAASPSRSASRPSTCVGIGLLCLMLADPA